MKIKQVYKELLSLLHNFNYISENEIIRKGIDLAEKLSGSGFSYFLIFADDEKTINTVEWSDSAKENYNIKDLQAYYSAEKNGVWAECAYQRKVFINNDYSLISNKKWGHEESSAITRDLAFPLIDNNKIVSIIGLANKKFHYTDKDVELISELSHNLWSLIKRKRQEKLLKKTELILKKKNVEYLAANQEINQLNEEYLTINEELNQLNEELIASKRETEESEIRFKALHNASFGGIAIHEKGTILECNWGLSEMMGYSYGELIGMDGLLLIGESEREFVMSQITAGDEKPYESIGVRKTGNEFPVRLEARNIPYKGKKVRVVEFRDISQQKIYEQELTIAKEKAEESDRLKSEFFRNLSHEVRTPLNAIIGFIDLLSMSDLSIDKRNDFINIIKNSGQQLVRIVEDILTISKIETKQVEIIENEVCLNKLLLELFSEFEIKAKERNIKLYQNNGLDDNESCIFADKTKLNTIISNLLENAIKFTEEGFVEFGYSLKVVNEQYKLEIYVKDTGIGIAQENQKMIFKRFAQESQEFERCYGGLGLGLSIVKEMVELMNGEITLKSKQGEGASFFVNLPYKQTKEVYEKVIPKNSRNEDLKNEKYSILIAEDNLPNYKYLEILLSDEIKLNCMIYNAKNGKEAVDMCRHYAIDLILMDLKMPVMDGLEASKLIKKDNPNIPIVVQTAFVNEDEIAKAKFAGCNDYITKPITPDLFRNTLLKLLQKNEK